MAGKTNSGAAQSKRAFTPKGAPQAARPKTIVLFSDGTGNSSAKLFKTNVWRFYEALDLAPPDRDSDRLQVAYYDNGVGTSNFRPLRLLGGIFGFGLKAGVLRLYRYLCRNYRPGDTIYAFGFSRGAFTIRLLVGLIASQGLVRCDDEGDLHIQSKAAYRELCRSVWPNKRPARDLVGDLRKVRDRLVKWKRRAFDQRPYDSVEKCHPDIQFVGVWDTVAAYGGPFAEITRGIDDWSGRSPCPTMPCRPRFCALPTPLRSTTSATPSCPCCGMRFAKRSWLARGKMYGRTANKGQCDEGDGQPKGASTRSGSAVPIPMSAAAIPTKA